MSFYGNRSRIDETLCNTKNEKSGSLQTQKLQVFFGSKFLSKSGYFYICFHLYLNTVWSLQVWYEIESGPVCELITLCKYTFKN